MNQAIIAYIVAALALVVVILLVLTQRGAIDECIKHGAAFNASRTEVRAVCGTPS